VYLVVAVKFVIFLYFSIHIFVRFHIHNKYHTRAIPKVSSLDILDSNIFYNLYISETYIF